MAYVNFVQKENEKMWTLLMLENKKDIIAKLDWYDKRRQDEQCISQDL